MTVVMAVIVMPFCASWTWSRFGLGSPVMEVTFTGCRVVAARDKTRVILPAVPSGAKARQHHHKPARTHRSHTETPLRIAMRKTDV